jgi:hypothetical protein
MQCNAVAAGQGFSLDFAPLEQDARDGVEVAGGAGRMILTA